MSCFQKSGRGGCAFIEGEAELSGDEGSTDESEDSDYDKMDGDFINDASQLSQEGQSVHVNPFMPRTHWQVLS